MGFDAYGMTTDRFVTYHAPPNRLTMNQPTKLPEVWPFPDQRAVLDCLPKGGNGVASKNARHAKRRPPLTDIPDAPY